MTNEEQREVENAETSLVPMNSDEMQSPGFEGVVEAVKVTKEYPFIDGAPDTTKDKSLYVTCELRVPFMEDKLFQWRWRVSRSTQGLHATVLKAMEAVKVFNADGEDTGKVGIALKDVADLEGQKFYFERKTVQLGSFKKENFPLPAIYYLPPENKEE